MIGVHDEASGNHIALANLFEDFEMIATEHGVPPRDPSQVILTTLWIRIMHHKIRRQDL